MGLARAMRSAGASVLDFALPPRCPGCGTIAEAVDVFCAPCWASIDWLGHGGCETCGLPLQATESEQCGRCLARPPRIARARAAMAYGAIARALALKLKYTRRVTLARPMARFMAPLVAANADALLVPVPLHRRRLWWRGFNQSALIARRLSRLTGHRVALSVLTRRRSTRPLKAMSAEARRREVRGAFDADRAAVAGKTIVLVDDVMTTGSTAEACAAALLRAGAERVELVCFARVVGPSRL